MCINVNYYNLYVNWNRIQFVCNNISLFATKLLKNWVNQKFDWLLARQCVRDYGVLRHCGTNINSVTLSTCPGPTVQCVALTSGVIVENASHVEILNQYMVNGVNGDVMENVHAPAVAASRRNTASATVHHQGMVAITVLVNESNIAVVASKNAREIVWILGMCINMLFLKTIPLKKKKTIVLVNNILKI